jgi:acetyltransferase EpsM
VVADIIRLRGEFEIVGFIDDLAGSSGDTQHAVAPILGGREQLDGLAVAGVKNVICAVGDCGARLELAAFAQSKGFSLATAIHPHAVVADGVNIGQGTVVAAGAVINSGSTLGENVIINTGATADHECDISDGAHLSPGVHLGGRVSIGRGTWLGIGAVVKEKVKIGARTIVGAGAVVVSDIPEGVLAYGVPARVILET